MFVFKLQTVLDSRKAFEEKVQGEFSDRKRHMELETAALEGLRRERRQVLASLQAMQDRLMSVNDIRLHVGYGERLRDLALHQEDVVRQAAEELELKRKELLEAVKKRKVLENLRARYHREYEEQMAMWEKKALDEMAIQQYARRAS